MAIPASYISLYIAKGPSYVNTYIEPVTDGARQTVDDCDSGLFAAVRAMAVQRLEDVVHPEVEKRGVSQEQHRQQR